MPTRRKKYVSPYNIKSNTNWTSSNGQGKTFDYIQPNVEDLWNLETIGIKSNVQSELFQRRRDDTIKKQLVKDIIEKVESGDVNNNKREQYAVIGTCVVFLVHGTILQQWTSLLKNSASIEKRKNLARDCWRIVPATVEKSCQWLLNNRASDCWRIMPVTVEESCQPLLINRASDCWTIVPVTVKQSCQWLLKNHASHCWIIVLATVEQSCQWLLNNRASDRWWIVAVAEQSCQRLLNIRASYYWRIMPVTVEESC